MHEQQNTGERECASTYHKACTSADHEHGAGAVQAALLVEATTMRAGDEEVGHAETETANDKVEDSPR